MFCWTFVAQAGQGAKVRRSCKSSSCLREESEMLRYIAWYVNLGGGTSGHIDDYDWTLVSHLATLMADQAATGMQWLASLTN